MPGEKQLFINSVRQIRMQGNAVIPTTVLYDGQKCFIGFDAITRAKDAADIKEDFKVEIGNDSPIKLARRAADTGRSTLGIAKDFIDAALSTAGAAIEMQGLRSPTRVLVAEPLSLKDDTLAHEQWLQNYRKSLKGILASRFAEIDFMPEPFAVFQYYRYGVRHALVAQKQKHVALVFDFGGGTFDASVIETTASGDISQSGRNSKPLAARSIPFGGFAINRIIADYLQSKALDRGYDKATLGKARAKYSELKNLDDEELKSHRAEFSSFTRNYRKLLQSVEQAKIAVCSGITNWRLEANLGTSPACPVEVPTDPLHDENKTVPIRLEPENFRTLFETYVWKGQLLPAIRETLRNAERELDSKPISIVLLSGGSSNFRWVKPLVQRDLDKELHNAEILELNENFQEIVAKGLAVECARRFYTEGSGDFRAVTYNRLCLILSPNSTNLEIKRFDPESPELGDVRAEAGVLLPSSTSLRGLIGRPLRWKVRLNKPPSHMLDYYFLRSSFDPQEASARHNLDSRVLTPRNVTFGGSIIVELIVREDGTATPSFIYGHGMQGHNTTVVGKPFYVDMTFAGESAGGETYLGFDFGTSTSSVCYVDENDIRVYAEREQSQTWLSLSSLVDILPYPAAHPLARFLSETTPVQMEHWGREALEGILAISAYVAYAECCARTKPGHLFKGLPQRSAGPLWNMLQRCADQSRARWQFAAQLGRLLDSGMFQDIDHAVTQIALYKHGKKADGVDFPRLLEKCGNILASAFDGKAFGFFEDTLPKAFSTSEFHGVFRNARGSRSPFIDVFDYEGKYTFPKEFVYLVDIGTGTALPMFPLFVRGLERTRGQMEDPDIYLFDVGRAKDGKVSFRAIQEKPAVDLKLGSEFDALFRAVAAIQEQDGEVMLLEDVQLSRRALT